MEDFELRAEVSENMELKVYKHGAQMFENVGLKRLRTSN
jgi:hypothetical protein